MADSLDDEVLQVLSNLIAFKNRADAKGWREAFENMAVYLERIGLTTEELDKLPVIHVAGTKGKGSTCAVIENILRTCGYRTGLYTSPHLVDVRERVRIDGQMVSKRVFEQEFWQCHERFTASATEEVGVPGYFRFMTLLALKIFLSQSVDVVVLEVGIGGRLDATNVIPHPIVCGITSLGFDHMETLGDTLPKIAREKAGILKPGRPAFTMHQPDDAMEALQEVAARVGAPLKVTGGLDSWRPADASTCARMSLGGEHQRLNGGLAVQLCAAYEEDCLARGRARPGAEQRVQQLRQGVLPHEYLQGLATTVWPGRSQVVHEAEFIEPPSASETPLPPTASTAVSKVAHPTSRLSFFIDGAHTPESMVTCAEWFAVEAATQPKPPGTTSVERVLLFNCMKEREPSVLLPALSTTLAAHGITLDHTLFAPPQSQYGFLPTKQAPYAPGSAPITATPTHTQPAAASTGTAGNATSGTLPPLPDYSWQLQLQNVWLSQCASNHQGRGAQIMTGVAALPLPPTPGLPVQDTCKGAIAPSLGSAIEWLRSVARARPQVQLQVLVAGSLYLVGDVLKMLGKAPK